MKLAFVFAGGGAKGAYQIGFLKAMEELGISPDIVTGTSIGALNGCMVAQQDKGKLYELWETMSVDKVVKGGFSTDFSMDSLLTHSNLLISFFKEYITNNGANITPLIETIKGLANAEKLQTSPIDFGLVTIEYPSLNPVEITKKDIPPTQLVDYLIASASCFPAFPIHHFNHKSYIDGGYYDNLPIHLAFKMNATHIVACELNHKDDTHLEYTHRPNIKIIRPYNDIGGFLDFDQKVLISRVWMGYYDTLKAYEKYYGYQYTLNDYSLSFTDDFYYTLLDFEGRLNREKIYRHLGLFNETPLTSILLDHTRKLELDTRDYALASLELLADYFNIDHLQVYSFKQLNDLVMRAFNEKLNLCKDSLNESTQNIPLLTQFLNNLNSDELLCFIYTRLKDRRLSSSLWIVEMFTKSTLLALYLYQYQKET